MTEKRNFSTDELDEILARHERFTHCKFVDSNAGPLGDPADLSNSDLRKANLRNRDLRLVRLDRCDLRGADFTGANIEHVRFTNSDLRGAKGLTYRKLRNRAFVQGAIFPRRIAARFGLI
jgi:uncharacterized protein YjbI with pentapeptide repeats